MKILKIVNCDQCYWYNGTDCIHEHKYIPQQYIDKCIFPDWCPLEDMPPNKVNPADGASTCPGGVYYIEYLESDTIRLVPRR
jgi:hypothetical protein